MSNLPPHVTDADIEGAVCKDFEFVIRVSVWAPDYDTALDLVKSYEYDEVLSVEPAP